MPNFPPSSLSFTSWNGPIHGSYALAVGAILLLALTVPLDAESVLISTGDGTGNTTPPAADPGFDNLGVVNGLSGVYVGNGWVLASGSAAMPVDTAVRSQTARFTCDPVRCH